MARPADRTPALVVTAACPWCGCEVTYEVAGSSDTQRFNPLGGRRCDHPAQLDVARDLATGLGRA